MTLLAEYQQARNAPRGDLVARLRCVIALRAMYGSGMTQRQMADVLNMSQSTVSRQLRSATALGSFRPDVLLEAAGPVLKSLAREHGYDRLAVFGSIARGSAQHDSDIDLIVDPPPGTSSFGFVLFKAVLEQTIGREIDLVSYGGLQSSLDADIQQEALLL
jgi:predicted nucleotidyltransferase/DNA-binding CsgD family transcriptional regulator